MNNRSILLAGGGTGEHVYPGISLLKEFEKAGVKAWLLTGRKDIEQSKEYLQKNKEVIIFKVPEPSGNILKKPSYLIRYFSAMLKAMIILKKEKIGGVMGIGGYVSAPVLSAAKISGIPFFLCEQNTVPGKVTVKFAKNAVNVFISFEITAEYLKNIPESVVLKSGNPVRENIFNKLKKPEAKKIFNLSHCRQVILIMGGSRRADRLNELIIDVLTDFSDELREIGIIWITGVSSFKKYKQELKDRSCEGSVYVCPFIENIGTAYKACDIVVSRSKAGAVMEFAVSGLPSVLIPYPDTESHQENNADVFAAAGAAVKMKNNESADTLGNIIFDILNNPVKLARMSEAARSLARMNAASEIAVHVNEKIRLGGSK